MRTLHERLSVNIRSLIERVPPSTLPAMLPLVVLVDQKAPARALINALSDFMFSANLTHGSAAYNALDACIKACAATLANERRKKESQNMFRLDQRARLK